MAQTKIKAAQFSGVIGNGVNGYVLQSSGDGDMDWVASITPPAVTSLSYPGSATAADPAGGQTVTITGTGFASGATVTVGGTAAPAVSFVSATTLTITTPAKAAGDYDVVVTNTDTGSATFINGISYNGIPAWTTAAGSLGTFASAETISTITLAATEPDGGTITFNITNGALPTGLSLTGANIDGTTSLETAETLYTFTVTATDDESQTTPRVFTITVKKEFKSYENFTINTYTGNGSTQSIEGKIGTAADFNGSSSEIVVPTVSNIKSYSFWIKAVDIGSNYGKRIFGLDSSSYTDCVTYTGNTSSKVGVVDGAGNTFYSDTVSDNNWHHIAITTDGNTLKIYTDGAVSSTNSTTYFTSSFTHIGSNNTNRQFKGNLDQIRIFDKELSSSEVTTLYGESNTSTTKSTTDIFDDDSGVALYEFEEGTKDTGGVTGYIGSGGIFNGSSSYISTSLNANNIETISYSFWVYWSSSIDGAVIGGLGNDGGSGSKSNRQSVTLIYSNNRFDYISRQGDFCRHTTSLSEGWHHFAITDNNGTDSSTAVNMYIDGNEVSFSQVDTGNFSTNTELQIGRTRNNSGSIANYFNGKIDQVRIFNKALSSSEVTTLSNETSASATKSTTDIFDDSSSVALYELEGNANDTGTNDFEHHFFVSDAGNQDSSARLNSVDSEFTYTRPSGYSEWGGTFDVNNQSHQSSGSSSYVTLSEGNKKWSKSGSYYNSIWGQNSHSSGKYYFELEFLGAELYFGISKLKTATTLHDGNNWKNNSIIFGSWSTASYKYSTTNTSSGAVLSTNDVIGFAVDFDNKELKYYINNTLQDTVSLEETIYNGTATNVTYAYDGTPTNVGFVGTSFQPDLVWIKNRNRAVHHALFDSVRGEEKLIRSNESAAEGTFNDSLKSFDSNGFSLGSDAEWWVNKSSDDYVAWCWKSGGAAVSNTDGTISSTVSANTDAGFSIVKWTGNEQASQTVGHGLSSSPKIAFIKQLDGGRDWIVPLFTETSGDYMELNDTAAKATDTNKWSAVSSITFTVGADPFTNGAGSPYIGYFFTSISGYQKIGSYTGTGSAVTVTTGFRPRFVIQKIASASGDWAMYDSVRGGNKILFPYVNNSELNDSTYGVTFNSNGFTINSGYSSNGNNYIYLAIA